MPLSFALAKVSALSAGIAQLVEHNLAKVGVASSNLVSRSNFSNVAFAVDGLSSQRNQRRNGRMAMQRIANPWISVRLRVPPPFFKGNQPAPAQLCNPCPGGEIGRHKGFKIPRW